MGNMVVNVLEMCLTGRQAQIWSVDELRCGTNNMLRGSSTGIYGTRQWMPQIHTKQLRLINEKNRIQIRSVQKARKNQIFETEIQHLGTHGYFVKDGWINDIQLLRGSVEQSEQLKSNGKLKKGSIFQNRKSDVNQIVRDDSVLFLNEVCPPDSPLGKIIQQLNHLRDEISEQAFLNFTDMEFQLACYSPSAHGYDRHADSQTYYSNVATSIKPIRILTCICYLNADITPQSPASVGGELRLFKNTYEGYRKTSDCEEHIDIRPYGGRLLVFFSHMDHAVLPVNHNRWALTTWFSK